MKKKKTEKRKKKRNDEYHRLLEHEFLYPTDTTQ